MFKYSLKSLLLSLVGLCLLNQYPLHGQVSDDKPNQKKGVKKVTEIYVSDFTEKFSEFSGEMTNQTIYEYDLKGNLISKMVNDQNFELQRKEIFKYDINDNLIDESEYNSDGSLEEKTIYKYNSDNEIIEEARYNSDESLIKKKIYQYDLDNNVKTFKYDSEKLIKEEKYKLKYDLNNNHIETLEYKTDGTLETIRKMRYDTNNNMVEWISFINGSLSSKFIYKYDSKNNEIENKWYTGGIDEPMFLTFFKYDENNNKILKVKRGVMGLSNKMTTYTYNSKNHVIEETHYLIEVKFGEEQGIPAHKIIYKYEYY